MSVCLSVCTTCDVVRSVTSCSPALWLTSTICRQHGAISTVSSLSDIRMSEALRRLRMSAEREESITGSLMILAVLFFLFAAVVVPSGHDGHDPDIHGSRINGSIHLKTRHQHEVMRESIFNEVYRRTFTKLRDEKQQFISAEEAKLMLPGHPESRRKVHCGGWVSDIPSVVLRFMGRRCPPLDLI